MELTPITGQISRFSMMTRIERIEYVLEEACANELLIEAAEIEKSLNIDEAIKTLRGDHEQ